MINLVLVAVAGAIVGGIIAHFLYTRRDVCCVFCKHWDIDFINGYEVYYCKKTGVYKSPIVDLHAKRKCVYFERGDKP